MGKKLADKQIKLLQSMFIASGAIEFGKNSVLEYSKKSKELLAKTELNDKSKSALSALIKKIEKLEQ